MENNTKKEWVIFYEDNDNGEKFYLHRIYFNLDNRVAFSNTKFTTFESVLDVNKIVDKIEDSFKLYYPNQKMQVGLCDINHK